MTSTDDLDAKATLAAAESSLRRRRAAEVEDLLLICRWADLPRLGPRRGPGGHRSWCGEDRLVEIGGDGTPLVRELSLPELAVARRVHTLSRRLDRFAVRIVDDAVADAIAGESPARVLELTRAKVIEADPCAHAERLEAELRKRYVGCSRMDEHGLRTVIARIEAGPAEFIDDLLDQVAEALDQRRDLVAPLPADAGRDELRAEAFGWLAHPDQVIELLEATTPATTTPETTRRRARRPRAVVHLHLHEAALHRWGVARVEELGPLLPEQVRRLLAHARVDLKPVIDLAETIRVNANEHPESVKERIHLRTIGEVFPHASRVSRSVDIDHPIEHDRDGPDGQTGDHNAAPPGPDPPSRQDPSGLSAQTARSRRLPLAHPPRPLPTSRPDRHPPHRSRDRRRTPQPRGTPPSPRPPRARTRPHRLLSLSTSPADRDGHPAVRSPQPLRLA